MFEKMNRCLSTRWN